MKDEYGYDMECRACVDIKLLRFKKEQNQWIDWGCCTPFLNIACHERYHKNGIDIWPERNPEIKNV